MPSENDESKGYGQYCPITRAVEVLGERWTMLVVRDLLCGMTRFNDLARGNPGLSRTLLSKRLKQLQRAGIVEHDGDEYRLTSAGNELRPLVFGLGEWSARWQFGEPRDSELDPELLMWWVHGRIDFSRLPDRRVVLEFRFRNPTGQFWIVRDSQGPSVCTYNPGFDVDAVIESQLATMYEVWLGRIPMRTAITECRVVLHGNAAMVQRLPEVLQLSPIAYAVAAVTD